MSSPLSIGLAARPGVNPNFELDVGAVMARAFSVWASNIAPFLLVGVVVQSPIVVTLLALGLTGGASLVALKLIEVLSNLLMIVLTGAVTYGVFQSLHDRATSTGDILRQGFNRLGTVFLTSLLVGLGVGLGSCALCVPGLIFATQWWTAVPVAVIEEEGATRSIGRSAELTEGNRWRVFALLVVFAVINIVLTLLIGAAVGAAEIAMRGTAQATADATMHPWSQLALTLLLLPAHALVAVTPAVVYHDLRIGKEGADVEDLLKVFA